MDRSVTVSAKGVLVALVAALALLAAYLLGNGGGGAAAAAGTTPSTGDHPRTLVMTGTGRTTGVPDEVTFSVSVGLLRGDLKTALADTNSTMNRVLAALTRAGVRRSDVQTTGLSMNAVYDYHASSPPTLRGYHVGQRAQVLVRSLADGGSAVTAAVQAGGNDVRVGDIGLKIGDTSRLLSQSRKAAVDDATAKAREYASATGQSLGPVLSLREVHSTPPSVSPMPYGRLAADTASAVPIRAGRDKLGVTVRIVWQLS